LLICKSNHYVLNEWKVEAKCESFMLTNTGRELIWYDAAFVWYCNNTAVFMIFHVCFLISEIPWKHQAHIEETSTAIKRRPKQDQLS